MRRSGRGTEHAAGPDATLRRGSQAARSAGETSCDAAHALALAEPDTALRPVLVVTDFDGTISPLVLDPWGARILPVARQALRRLAGLPDVHVVILSGRMAADVAARARVGGATYLGNHGIERGWLPRGAPAERLVVTAVPSLEEYRDPARELADGVIRHVPEPWLVVERKPPAVTFHYRRAPDMADAAARIAAAVDQLDPGRTFVRFPGRRALELRPPGAAAKGDSLSTLLDEFRPAAVFALGDDRSDAEAFGVLRAARAMGRVRGLALAVRARAEELPDVAAAADLVLASPADAAGFLSGLARRLAARPGGTATARSGRVGRRVSP